VKETRGIKKNKRSEDDQRRKRKKNKKGKVRFSGFANREKYPRYAVAKKIYVLFTKSFSP